MEGYMNNIKRREQLKEVGIVVADNISDEELDKLTDEEISKLIQEGYLVEINSENAVDSNKDAELFFDDNIDENNYLLTYECKGIEIDYKTGKTVKLKRGSYDKLFIKQLKDGLQKYQQNQDAIHAQIQDILYNGCNGFKAVREANTYVKLDAKDNTIKKIITTNHKFLYHENGNIVISSAPIIFEQLTNSRVEGNNGQINYLTTGNDFNSIFTQFEQILNKKPDAQIESAFNSCGHYQSATIFKKDGKLYMTLINPYSKDKITEYEVVKNKDGIYDATSLKNPKTYNNPDYKDYIVNIKQQDSFSCGFHSVILLLEKTRINLKRQLKNKNLSKEQKEKIEYDIKILEETLEKSREEFRKLYKIEEKHNVITTTSSVLSSIKQKENIFNKNNTVNKKDAETINKQLLLKPNTIVVKEKIEKKQDNIKNNDKYINEKDIDKLLSSGKVSDIFMDSLLESMEQQQSKNDNSDSISLNTTMDSSFNEETFVNNSNNELDENNLEVLVSNELNKKDNTANVGYINNLLNEQEKTSKYNEQYDYDNMSEKEIYRATDDLLNNLDNLRNNYVLWNKLFKLLEIQDDIISYERKNKINKKNNNKTKTR